MANQTDICHPIPFGYSLMATCSFFTHHRGLYSPRSKFDEDSCMNMSSGSHISYLGAEHFYYTSVINLSL